MVDDAIKKLIKDMEASLYYGDVDRNQKARLKEFLSKLGIKSAREQSGFGSLMNGIALQVESLDAVLKSVTFDSKDLQPLFKKKDNE